MGAAVDCERIGEGLLAQPINASTSLIFVAAAIVVVMWNGDRWVAAAMAATGIGSFLFHGPLAPGGDWAHDVTLAWLLLVVAGHGRRWRPITTAPGLAGIALLLWPFGNLGDALTVALFAAAAMLALATDRSRSTLMPFALLAVSAIVGRLGATGGPLCDPDSLAQPHGLWHVGAALAVTWWTLGQTASRASAVSRP